MPRSKLFRMVTISGAASRGGPVKKEPATLKAAGKVRKFDYPSMFDMMQTN
jgi:hypothetical protein